VNAPSPDPDDPREPPGEPAGRGAEIASEPSRLRRMVRIVGPGVITGASNDDPSAIAAYAQAGALFGFTPLWLVPILFPMMASTIYLCGKIGMASGRGMGGVLRDFYPRWVSTAAIFALIAANTFCIAADLGAIAAGVRLIVPLPAAPVSIAVAAALLAVQIRGSYRTLAATLKWLVLALFAYVGAGILARPDPAALLSATFVPAWPAGPGFPETVVAMVGTALSPYLYFWQTSQELEERLCRGRIRLRERKGASDLDLRYAWLDVITGAFFASVVIYFVILACGATLHAAGVTRVAGAADVARALEPLAGRASGVLFALGFIGAGLLAIPVLSTGAAYAFAEAGGWRFGLDRTPREARRFYGSMAAVTLAGAAVAASGVEPMRMLLAAAVVNGLLAPPLLGIIVHAANRRDVMGERHAGGLWLNVIGIATALAALAATTRLVISWLR
jgi:NRAMP (natural resistance-associated macrophage protein)-like metal ion transporter